MADEGFVCYICNRSFNTLKGVKVHRSRVHRGMKNAHTAPRNNSVSVDEQSDINICNNGEVSSQNTPLIPMIDCDPSLDDAASDPNISSGGEIPIVPVIDYSSDLIVMAESVLDNHDDGDNAIVLEDHELGDRHLQIDEEDYLNDARIFKRPRLCRTVHLSESEIELANLAYKHDLSQAAIKKFREWAVRNGDGISLGQKPARVFSTIQNLLEKDYVNLFGSELTRVIEIPILKGPERNVVTKEFYFEDPVGLIKELLMDPDIVSKETTSFGYNPGSVLQDSFYSISSSKWMRDATFKLHSEVSNCIDVLPVCLYTDGTTVTNVRNKSVKPIVLSLGCFNAETFNKRNSKKLIGYFPSLEEDEDMFGVHPMAGPGSKGRLLYHRVWSVILDRISEADTITLNLPNGIGMKTFKMVVSHWIGDMPEQIKLTGTFDNYNAAMPCRVCLVSKEILLEMNEIDDVEEMERFTDNIPYREEVQSNVIRETFKDVVPYTAAIIADNHRKRAEYSLQFETPSWNHRWPFSKYGVYQMSPPCRLHTFLSNGLCSKVLEYILMAVKYSGYPERAAEGSKQFWKSAPGNVGARIQKFDERFEMIPQFSRGSKYLKTFKNVSSAKFLQGHDFHGIAYQLPYIIGTLDNTIINDVAVTRAIREVVLSLIDVMEIIYNLKSYTQEDIDSLRKKIISFTCIYRTTFRPFLKTGLFSRKLHDLMHYPMFITIYGPPLFWDTASFEEAHKIFAKRPAKRTRLGEGCERNMMKFIRITRALYHHNVKLNKRNFREEVDEKNSLSLQRDYTDLLPLDTGLLAIKVLIRKYITDLHGDGGRHVLDIRYFGKAVIVDISAGKKSDERFLCRADASYNKGKGRFDNVEINWNDPNGERWFGLLRCLCVVKIRNEDVNMAIVRNYKRVPGHGFYNEKVKALELYLSDEFMCVPLDSILRRVHIVKNLDIANMYFVNERLVLR